MESLFLFEKTGFRRGYHSLKRLCSEHSIDYKKLPDTVKSGKVGFSVGGISVSILEVETRVKI